MTIKNFYLKKIASLASFLELKLEFLVYEKNILQKTFLLKSEKN